MSYFEIQPTFSHLSPNSSMVRASHRRSEGCGFESHLGTQKCFWVNIARWTSSWNNIYVRAIIHLTLISVYIQYILLSVGEPNRSTYHIGMGGQLSQGSNKPTDVEFKLFCSSSLTSAPSQTVNKVDNIPAFVFTAVWHICQQSKWQAWYEK